MPLRLLIVALLVLLALHCCSAESREHQGDPASTFGLFAKALAACEPRGTVTSSRHLDCIIGQVDVL